MAFAFVWSFMPTNVYIDGFNFYYGAVRGTPYKWVNLAELCDRLLPGRLINRIRYFTAPVVSLLHDPQVQARQEVYLRALQTIPNLCMHYGRFSANPVRLPIHPLVYDDPLRPPRTIRVLRTEEKRSDVNLATLLLIDCFDDDFDEAVVISNDSDLTLPIEYVVGKFGKTVGVINPHSQGRISRELDGAATWSYKQINKSVLASSQFPNVMADSHGPFHKPNTW